MRTTLTLDDDVAALIERLRRERRQPLKEIVNDALRRGLREAVARPRVREPFETSAVDLGGVGVGSIDDVAGVLAAAEGEDYR
jgi:Arc/MetJ family transcription regulator